MAKTIKAPYQISMVEATPLKNNLRLAGRSRDDCVITSASQSKGACDSKSWRKAEATHTTCSPSVTNKKAITPDQTKRLPIARADISSPRL